MKIMEKVRNFIGEKLEQIEDRERKRRFNGLPPNRLHHFLSTFAFCTVGLPMMGLITIYHLIRPSAEPMHGPGTTGASVAVASSILGLAGVIVITILTVVGGGIAGIFGVPFWMVFLTIYLGLCAFVAGGVACTVK